VLFVFVGALVVFVLFGCVEGLVLFLCFLYL
jgi:hypothetical protein